MRRNVNLKNSLMELYFETTVKYSKLQENGKVKKVNEPYLVNALSFTEAEAKVIEEVTPYISGDFTVSAVKKTNIEEVFPSTEGDYWYNVKINFISFDEKTHAEQVTPANYLVQAPDFEKALHNFFDIMKGTIMDYVISSITETKIMDVLNADK